MHFLQPYWRKYRRLFFLALLFLALEAMADLAQPALMAQIIDRGVKERSVSLLIHYGLWMLLITLGGALSACMRNILSVHVSQNFAKDLREDLYRSIHHFPIATIDHFGRATLMTRLTNDVTRVQTFANGTMRVMMKAPLIGIGSLIMAVRLNPRLSLILLAIIPVIACWILLNVKLSAPFYMKVQQALDQLNLRLQDYLRGVRVVKIFNRSREEVKRFAVDSQNLGQLSVSAARVGNFFGPLVTLSVNAGILAILWFGAIGVDDGTMQVGTVIAFTNYLMQILFAIMIVNNAFNLFVRAKASTERINAIMRCSQPKKLIHKPFAAMEDEGTLEFQDVFFHYPETVNNWQLQDISFRVEFGQMIGISGSVASGKTTLTRLILRFYDVDSGSILFDGRRIDSFSVDILRQRIAIVPQAPRLFSGTIRENICWGKPGASDAEVKRAAELAEADPFIRRTPLGYQSQIGQGGINLSGGQKQRLSLARALIRNPELLILDEATSAVDALTDKKIRRNLKSMGKKVTILMITQRVAALREADQIIILDEGKIEAVGTHHQLICSSPYYKTICEAQSPVGGECHG